MGYNKLTSLSANIKAIETAVAIPLAGQDSHARGKTGIGAVFRFRAVSRMYWTWVRTSRLTKGLPGF